MSKTQARPWWERSLLGLAAVGCGLAAVGLLGRGQGAADATVWLLFTLAVVSGIAKTGTG